MADIAVYISLNELMEVLENTGIIQFSDDAWISINDQYPVITGTVCGYPDVEVELMLKKHPLTYIFTIILFDRNDKRRFCGCRSGKSVQDLSSDGKYLQKRKTDGSPAGEPSV